MEAVLCISSVLVMQTKSIVYFHLTHETGCDRHHEIFLVDFLSVAYIHNGHSVLRRMRRYSDDRQTSPECKIHIQRSS